MDDRDLALRRARKVQRPPDGEEFALEVDGVGLRRVDENAAGTIVAEVPVLPPVAELIDDRDELMGLAVFLISGEMPDLAVILRRRIDLRPENWTIFG